MDLVLTLTRFLIPITTAGLVLSIISLIIGVVFDVAKKRFYWSKFAIILFAIILAMQIMQMLFIYSVTRNIPNNPDETANWKTYKNEQYGFSVQYPSNLISREQTSDTFLLNVSFKDQTPAPLLSGEFIIEVRKLFTLEEAVEQEKWRLVGHVTDHITKETSITQDIFKGVRLDYKITTSDPDDKEEFNVIVLSNNKYIYTIIARADSTDQILSTFQF